MLKNAGAMHRAQEDTRTRLLRIEIFGLGYVGFPLLVRAASARLNVTGIDTSSDRIKRLSEDQLHNSETRLKDTFIECKRRGYLSLDSSSKPSDSTRVGIICVPTPVPLNGVDSNVNVADAVKNFLKSARSGDIIIVESSVKIGTIDGIRAMIESAGYHVGEDFGLAFCPERVDIKNTKLALESTPRVIYCSDDITFSIAKMIYYHINNANLLRVSSAKVAETVKSFENAFRLVNISLVNELAILCDRLGISAREVISAAATKPVGFMPFYPGAGAGGHCVPKDPLFLLQSAKKCGMDFGTISNAFQTNDLMPQYVFDVIDREMTKRAFKKTVLVCGLAYKSDVDDMRDSPGFKVITKFSAAGYKVFTYDPYFDDNLIEKYMIENSLTEKNFAALPDLEDQNLGNISCICVVQHHAKIKFRLEQIYDESLVDMIYDCQMRLAFNPNSKTVLRQLG